MMSSSTGGEERPVSLQRPLSLRERPQAKEGMLSSKKFAGMKQGLPTWESSYSPVHLKVFNGKLRLEQGDRVKHEAGVVAWEMLLTDIKLITPVNDQGEFFLTAKHDGVRLVSMGEEDVGAQIMRGVQEMDLIGSSQQDLVFVFKAEKARSEEWVKFLEESRQIIAQVGHSGTQREISDLMAFKSTKITRVRSKRGVGTSKRKGKVSPKKRTAMFAAPRKRLVEGPMDPVYGALRVAAIVFSILAVCSVGPFYAAILLVSNATRREKRDYANSLQEVLAQAVIWVLPSYALHISGEAPTSYVNDTVYDDTGAAKDRSKGSSKAKIFILNRSSHADFLIMALLANEIDHSGHLRAILRGRKQLIQYIPFVGTMFTWFRFMFLSGNKRADEPRVRSYMRKLSQNKAEWLVFFPEPGPTPLTKEAIKASQKQADDVGRPLLDKVALPSSGLLETCISSLAECLEEHQDAEIYDITLAYTGYVGEYGKQSDPFARRDDKVVPSVYSLLFNRASRDFHVHSKLYSLKELKQTMEEEEGLEMWLDERFQEKDELLKYFTQHQTFVKPKSSDKNDSKAEIVESHGSITNMLYLWAATAVLYIGILVLLIVLLVIRSKMG